MTLNIISIETAERQFDCPRSIANLFGVGSSLPLTSAMIADVDLKIWEETAGNWFLKVDELF